MLSRVFDTPGRRLAPPWVVSCEWHRLVGSQALQRNASLEHPYSSTSVSCRGVLLAGRERGCCDRQPVGKPANLGKTPRAAPKNETCLNVRPHSSRGAVAWSSFRRVPCTRSPRPAGPARTRAPTAVRVRDPYFSLTFARAYEG